MKKSYLLVIIFSLIQITSLKAQERIRPHVSSRNNMLIKEVIKTNQDIQQFWLYKVVNDITFSKIIFFAKVQYHGDQTRSYNFDVGIYDSQGGQICNYQSPADENVTEVGFNKTELKIIIDLKQTFNLKAGLYYFAIYPKDTEIGKMGNAEVITYEYQCHDESYDDITQIPACIYRTVNSDDRLLPSWLPKAIFTSTEDSSHKYHRTPYYKAYDIRLNE